MMEMTQEEIIREMEALFPREFRIALLTITNRKQSDVIAQQAEQLLSFRNNGEFWEGTDKPVPLRSEKG